MKGAAQILRDLALPIEFRGFVEGDDIAEGTVDVVVTDGFTGNVALKTAEGTAKLVAHFLRSALTRSLLRPLRRAVSRAARCSTLRRKLDPRAANGGIFLGLNGVVVKSHGGTDALGFASALDMAIDMARADVIARIIADRARPSAPIARHGDMPEAAASDVIRSVVLGCGAYLPDNVLTNDDLAKRVDTSDEWIRERTGIRQRHIAARGRKDVRPRAARPRATRWQTPASTPANST